MCAECRYAPTNHIIWAACSAPGISLLESASAVDELIRARYPYTCPGARCPHPPCGRINRSGRLGAVPDDGGVAVPADMCRRRPRRIVIVGRHPVSLGHRTAAAFPRGGVRECPTARVGRHDAGGRRRLHVVGPHGDHRGPPLQSDAVHQHPVAGVRQVVDSCAVDVQFHDGVVDADLQLAVRMIGLVGCASATG